MPVPPTLDRSASSPQCVVAPDDSSLLLGDSSLLSGAWALLLGGCALPQRWRHQPRFTVLDLGPADPRRVWTTLTRLALAPDGPARLEYVALLQDPPDAALIGARLGDTGLVAPGIARRLMAGWPSGAPGLHPIDFDDDDGLPSGHRARLIIAIGEPIGLLGRLRLAADAVFIDSRTPVSAQLLPAQLASLPRLMAPGARLSALIAVGDAAQADAALRERGFEPVDSGPLDLTDVVLPVALVDQQPAVRRVASLNQRRQPAAIWASPPAAAQREAIVIGAGLAGCASAAVLAERGWRVTVLDAAGDLHGAGGGQPRVADHPHFSADDNRLARLSRHGLWLGARWRAPRAPLGRVQLAASAADWQLMARWCASGAIHPSVARCVDAQEASALTGLRLPRGGLWIPDCDAVAPAALCRQWLDSSPNIEWRPNVTVSGLQRDANSWLVFGPDGTLIHQAAVVILANAGGAQALAGMRWPLLQRTRGQSTRVQASAWEGLRSVLGGSAYACPLADGEILVGATAEEASMLIADPEADRSNLARLQAMLGPPHAADAPASRSEPAPTTRPAGIGWRFAAPDHLPLIGALPDETQIARSAATYARNDRLTLPTLPGLYGHFALGSRGLLWSMLGAEVLAAMIDGGASPLEGDLLQAIDPSRFVRHRLRRALPI